MLTEKPTPKHHIVKNIDLGKLGEEQNVPQANTTRHRKLASKDANIFEFDMPEEETKVQRAKVTTNTKKFMKQTKELNSSKNTGKISTIKRNQFHKSVFDHNESSMKRPPNVAHQDSSHTIKTKTKKSSKDFGGSNDLTNSIGDIGKIKYKINTINSITRQGIKKIEIGIAKKEGTKLQSKA